MEKQFEILRKTRAFLLNLINELSLEEVNKIPQGFNNNIAWNFGHIIAAQQGVCYKRSGLPMVISEELFNQYKPESRPEKEINESELEGLKSLLFSTIEKLEDDYQSGNLSAYVAWKTRYGVEINSIEDAISFLSYHDGVHTGYCMALKRAIKA